METTRVIKVKFGDTLRRFNAGVVSEGQLDFDMDGLRAKIVALFSFDPDTEFTLTYVDEDGDVVTLVNDDDLRDAVRQQLKFLRLEVQLNNNKSGKWNARSSGNSTPQRSPRVQNPLPIISNGASEVLKSLPDPLREVLSKSLDMASKAASQSSNHVFNDLVECISKLGQSSLNFSHQSNGDANSSTQAGASQVPDAASVVLNVSKDGANTSTQAGASQVPDAPSVVLNVSKDGANTSTQTGASQKPTAPSNPAVSNATRDGFMRDILNQMSSNNVSMPEMPTQKELNLAQDAKFCDLSNRVVDLSPPVKTNHPSKILPPFPNARGDIGRKDNKAQNSQNLSPTPPGFGSSTGFRASAGFGRFGASTGFDASSFFPTAIPGFPPRPPSLNECPFSGMPASDVGLHSRRPHRPIKKNSIHSAPVLHKSVKCDGCGAHPITGPRFKSKVKEDYDLCISCFVDIGNATDYLQLDRPVAYRHPHILKTPHDLKSWDAPIPGVIERSGISQPPTPILDSHFVLDVNVLDDTTIAPSTNFTKIWRMRNNGNVAWPRGVRIMWTGGQRLSHADYAELEIPEVGIPVDGELDVSVAFTAPDSPGHYKSIWRMVNPSGVKFGQHVWVQIEVIFSPNDSVRDGIKGLNLNLPALSDNSNIPMDIDVKADTTVEDGSKSVTVPAAVPVDDEQEGKKEDPELNFPINDTLLVGNGVVDNGEQPQAPITYPTIDFPEAVPDLAGLAPSAPSQPLPTTVGALSSPEEESANSVIIEEILLKELEEMGFKEIDLNKEILRTNGYNLAQSVDELCEWDPILEELEEMGFSDKEKNKKLLKKNNGSIKRVVMDILTGDKD